MELKKIKTDLCPHCGSEPISEEKLNFNPFKKEFIEVRSFECGLKLMGINEDVVVDKKCPNSKEYKDMANSRVKALNRLLRFVDELDVDEEFKYNLHLALTYKLTTE